MGILPWSSARGRLHPQGGRAGLSAHGTDEDLELASNPELSEGLHAVQAVASAPVTPRELQGLEAVMAEYRATVPVSTLQARHEARHEARHGGRRVMTPETLGARIGVAAAGVLLLGFSGAGAFALTGSLPGGSPASTLPAVASTTAAAHVPVKDGDDEREDDKPEDDGTARPKAFSATAVGPDATGPAAFGLCNAWSHAKDTKKTAEHSVAFRNLVKAAGGVDKVDGYCAKVEHPSAKAGDTSNGKAKGKAKGKAGDAATGHPTGKPTTKPGKGPQDKPGGQQGRGNGTQGSATASPTTGG
jgi:hypothetical protein